MSTIATTRILHGSANIDAPGLHRPWIWLLPRLDLVHDNDAHPLANPPADPPPLAGDGGQIHDALRRLSCAAGALTAMVAVAAIAACGSCRPDVPALGSVSLTWTMADANGRPLSCEQISATTVLLTLRERASGSSVTASFPCRSSPSAQLLGPGVYDATIALRTGEGATIATVSDQASVLVVAAQVTPLAPAMFSVTAGLVLSFATSAIANCTSPAEGGAAITSATLILAHTGAGCAPVTFVRKRGNTVVERYLVNCSSPAVTSCIETSETFTVLPIDPGSYSLRVRARVGALNCWVRDEDIDVSLGAPVTRTINLIPTRIAGCPPVQLGATGSPSGRNHE
jgi:hypothetical protein